MGHPAPLLVAYDAESAPCRALVDWVRHRDRACLVVAFPYQHAELVHLAPELAGQTFREEVHGLDTRTRQVRGGAALLPSLFRRLPGWRILAPLLTLPALANLAWRWLRRSR